MKRNPIKVLPSQSELLKKFRYDEETGQLFRQMSFGLKKIGWVEVSDGYIRISYKNSTWFAHRIIWKMKTGNDPVGSIDHIDGTKINRWDNLRDVTHDQNMWNSKRFHNNTSGYRGVSLSQDKLLWRARITVGNKRKHLGYFNSPELAHQAFADAVNKMRDEYARV